MKPQVTTAVVGNVINIVMGYVLTHHTSTGFGGIELSRLLGSIVQPLLMIPCFYYHPHHCTRCAHAVLINSNSIVWKTFMGLEVDSNIRVGNCLGANAPKQVSTVSLLLMLGISSTFSFTPFILRGSIPSLFLNDPQGVAHAVVQGILHGAGKQKDRFCVDCRIIVSPDMDGYEVSPSPPTYPSFQSSRADFSLDQCV
ncbi:Multidrug/Oligosaccharidyl-lipid/Polysaccharide (MOP) Flippase Superfamily [Phytophthora cinnamomi]|uniref:Multidrug/Oligosaccharidyl-lipid/Polysaccharide (MOP) Flippase Superfamily n=1 Tax=Phytophthora cinnamomi TaxID=4785 RepID=UPI003559C188|nr:Multidrug/Oligosaccharidyl-lipid/Polysaccharide (MOP) Flippase Superfamily [Phytophthora cinnamomi]